jgi:hypothetical protein
MPIAVQCSGSGPLTNRRYLSGLRCLADIVSIPAIVITSFLLFSNPNRMLIAERERNAQCSIGISPAALRDARHVHISVRTGDNEVLKNVAVYAGGKEVPVWSRSESLPDVVTVKSGHGGYTSSIGGKEQEFDATLPPFQPDASHISVRVACESETAWGRPVLGAAPNTSELVWSPSGQGATFRLDVAAGDVTSWATQLLISLIASAGLLLLATPIRNANIAAGVIATIFALLGGGTVGFTLASYRDGASAGQPSIYWLCMGCSVGLPIILLFVVCRCASLCSKTTATNRS